MNKVHLMGRLCGDPELTFTQTAHTAVCKFILAVDPKFKKEGSEKETDFIPIIAWRQTAEFICKYFKKGDKILIEDGCIEVSHWQDKDDKRIYKTQVKAEQVGFVEKRKDKENDQNDYPADTEEVIPEDYDLEDGLPF